MPERRSSSRSKPTTRSRSTKKRSSNNYAGRVLGTIALIAALIGTALTLSWANDNGYIDLEQIIAILQSEQGGATGTGEPPAEQPPAVSQGGEIELYFTTPNLVYPDVPRNRLPPPHEQAIIADIDGATSSIDFATFEYNLTSIAEALARAQARGVAVRLALDRESVANPVMGKWAGIVEDARIPIAWEDSEAFLHSKFIIIDQRVVWTGSWNATINDTYRNNNNILRMTVPALVENYRAEFEQLFARTPSTSKQSITPHPTIEVNGIPIANYFSPQDAPEQYIVERIEQAQESVLFLAFAFTSDPITEAMIARKAEGVRVEGVMEERNVEGTGSEYGKLRRADVPLLKDGNCYTMHHKVMIIDGRTVITGSFNFTGRANELNVENLLIIDDPTLAARYTEEYERVWQQAENPTRCG
jgi:phosphatidylserine/phosphatidylglycerophosphate/cardiolipin synthase-like enzyme